MPKTRGVPQMDGQNAVATVVTREHIALCAKKCTPSDGGVRLLDCTASDHMTYRRDLLRDFSEASGEVAMGDGAPLKIIDECGGKDVELSEVLLAPELQDNLLSLGRNEEKGLKIITYQGISKAYKDEKLIFQAHRVGRMYYMTTLGGVTVNEIKREYDANKKSVAVVSFQTWHSRLGHPNEKALRKLSVLEESMGKGKREEMEDCLP
ncbi:hypothetical protein J437_LFUL002416, partial [Ladona fulva]